MARTTNFAIVAAGALISLVSTDVVRAAETIPVGDYAANAEICKVSDADYGSLADFRARYGSNSLVQIDDKNITFGVVPAYCEIAKVQPSGGPTTLRVTAECNVSGNSEDVEFEIAVKPNALAFLVVQGPNDGWFSPDFKQDYVLCPKKQDK